MTVTVDHTDPGVAGMHPKRAPTKYGRPDAKATEATVVAGLALVSVLNYSYSVILVWMLPASQYAVVGSASALLLICGTVSSASIPWVLAREVALGRSDPRRRQAAVAFCVMGTAVEALVAGAATCLIAVQYASNVAVAMTFGSIVAIFTAATAVGYLQGLQRFKLIASLRVAEVVVKVGAGLTLVALGAGAAGALAGFGFGAVVVAAVALVVMGPDLKLRPPWRFERALWLDARGLMSIQAGVAILSSLDVVVASVVLTDKSQLATYQVAQILTRVPIFLATGLSMVAFPRLTAVRADVPGSVRNMLRLFASITIPVAIMTATLPNVIIVHLFPANYDGVARLLAWGTLGGAFMGTINLVTTFFQARGVFSRPTAILAGGVVAQVGLVILGLTVGGVLGLAVCVAVGAVATATALLWDLRRRWPGSTSGIVRHGLVVAVVAGPLWLLRDHVVLWAAWLVVGGAAPAMFSLVRFRQDPTSDSVRPRVLHLGYEDPRRPGAGGGSARNQAINARLAETFDITVVCARYRGARARVDHGVRYVHVGLPLGYFGSLVAYFLCIPLALLRYPSDLVVEDFGAPLSTVAVPWLTHRPVVGVVQWLFAREKSEQYHFPFHFIEALGLRSHRRLVAVSADLAATLQNRNPRADVHVVANGLDDDAFVPRGRTDRRDVVFLGRLEIAQKGLDLLLEAFALVADRVDGDLVIGGDGPDAAVLLRVAVRLGISHRVRFAGRVAADERLDFLAGAALVVMPSRYETFGMVAAEALAVGTPVLAFDIPCLRALITPENGVLVPAMDVDRYANELADMMADKARRSRLGRVGAASVAHLRWDWLAASQAEVYRDALGLACGRTDLQPIEPVGPIAPMPSGAMRFDDAAGVASKRADAGQPFVPNGVGPNSGPALAAILRSVTKRSRPRLLVIGNYGAGNTGDEAVLAGLADSLTATADVTVLSRRPTAVMEKRGVDAVQMVSLRAVGSLVRTDVIAVGGGGMFGKGLPPLVAVLPVVLIAARCLLRKRIVLQALGVYPDTPRATLATLQMAAAMANGVFLRDERSVATISAGRLGSRVKPMLVADSALFMRAASPDHARRLLGEHGIAAEEKPLLLSIKATPDLIANDRTVAILADVASWWIRKHGTHVVVLPLSVQGDYGLGRLHADAALGERARALSPVSHQIKILPAELDPHLAKAVVGEASAVVGMRFHSLVFAVSMQRPVLGLLFEHKTTSWMAQIGGAQLPVPGLDAEAVIRWLETSADIPRSPQ